MDDVIQDEVTIPEWTTNGRFVLEAFSDSSWADCKTTRRSTSSGLIFLNGSLLTSICRTQASVALSSCEAELYAANGLMVESLFLYRLCKFLVGDETEGNNETVEQRLYMDSSSAMALIRRSGTGRLKHIQIKQFYLQSLLRSGIFSIFKVHTKLNPGDLNTKRLGGERRKFLGRLIGLYTPNESETNDDSSVRRIRRVNRATREQCVRLIQMANVTLGLCMQLKGCSSGESHLDPVTGGSADEATMVWWTFLEWSMWSPMHFIFYVLKVLSITTIYVAQFIGFVVMIAAMYLVLLGPMTWRHYGWFRHFTLRNAAWLMGLRFRFLVKPALWMSWWTLKHEIIYLHARYRESGQEGDFMVDIEGLYGELDGYLTGGQNPVGTCEVSSPEPPVEERDDRPRAIPLPLPEGLVDIAEAALANVQQWDGQRWVDGGHNGVHHGQERQRDAQQQWYDDHNGVDQASGDESDDMEVDESPEERRTRYLAASQDEVSDPDEWANYHYGHAEEFDYDRIVAYSRANQLRLERALVTLSNRRANAEANGDWEEAHQIARAMHEIEALHDIA